MACGAICGGENVRYQARARYSGMRRWHLLGTLTRSRRLAMRRLSTAMLDLPYRQGEIVMLADYYEPVAIYEVRQR